MNAEEILSTLDELAASDSCFSGSGLVVQMYGEAIRAGVHTPTVWNCTDAPAGSTATRHPDQRSDDGRSAARSIRLDNRHFNSI